MAPNSQNSRQMGQRGLPALLIGAWGLYQIILGLYFILIRPSFLPEDLRASGTTLEAVRSAAPGIEAWLNLVFAVLGGQMAASGVLLTATAWRVFKGHHPAPVEVAACIVAGLLSVTLMSAVNFVLGSDFRWLLIAPVILWLAVIVVLCRRTSSNAS